VDCNFFGQFITNKTNLYPLNKSSNIIVEKLGCQNCVIVHIGNVNHDMALNQIRKKKKKL
jgi:Zn-finger protein